MKRYLLLGCGNDDGKRIRFEADGTNGPGSPEEDFSGGELVRLDYQKSLNPDVVWDLNDLPYPFEDNEFDEIHAYEVLEHCGTQGDGEFFFAQFGEFWRILKPNGYIMISVPRWDSVAQWEAPDHKRVFPKGTFSYLGKDYYENIGKPGYGDYRNWLKGRWMESIGYEENETNLFVCLIAIKENQ